jgi:hypothetical protein
MALTALQRTFLVTGLGVQPGPKIAQVKQTGESTDESLKLAADAYLRIEKETLDRIKTLRSYPGTKRLVRRLESEMNDIRDHVSKAHEAGGQDTIDTGTRLVGDLFKIARRAVDNKAFYETFDTATETLEAMQAHPQHAHVDYETDSADRALNAAHGLAEDGKYDEASDELSIANERLREARRCVDQYARTMAVKTDGERLMKQMKDVPLDQDARQTLVSDFEAAAQLAEPPARRYGKARTDMQAVIDRMKVVLEGPHPNPAAPSGSGSGA